MKVVSLVGRHGKKRSFHVANVSHKTIGPILRVQSAKSARNMSEDTNVYDKVGKEFVKREKADHGAGEHPRGNVTTNTAESGFAILKRGLYGTFHSVSERHIQHYGTEFDFRWNYREKLGYTDIHRANIMLAGIAGKRLMYRNSDCC